MKSFIFITLALAVLVLPVDAQSPEPAGGKFAFTVKPEILGLAGGSFGYKLPSDIVLSAGVDFYHLGMTVESKTSYMGVNLSGSTSTTDLTLNLYNLYAAGKFYIVSQNAVKGYLLAEVSKPIVSGASKRNEQEDENLKQTLDNMSIWGLKGAFGAEYFFSDNFSLGGEFGFRMLLISTNMSNDSPAFSYDYQLGQVQIGTQRNETTVDIGLSLTYSTLTVNFYF
jgi:hypothetical protein